MALAQADAIEVPSYQGEPERQCMDALVTNQRMEQQCMDALVTNQRMESREQDATPYCRDSGMQQDGGDFGLDSLLKIIDYLKSKEKNGETNKES